MATTDRRREQNRVNKANQRARDRARAAGAPVPREVKKYPATQAAHRAFEAKEAALARRIERLENLPSVLSPTTNIQVTRDQPRAIAGFSRKSPTRQAAALRESARNQKLSAVGSGRRRQLLGELDDTEHSKVYNALTPGQRKRFAELSKRLAKGSNQSLAILFEYQGGAAAYNSILSDLIYPDAEAIDEALDALEALAELGDKARTMYSPKNHPELRNV